MSTCALIVEDNPVNVEYLSALLRAQGMETIGAYDGFQGLEMARAQHLDLVLCDLQMPRMSGFDFLEALRSDKNLLQLPVLAVTACDMEGDQARIQNAGFDGYVAKPVEPGMLIETVERVLGRSVSEEFFLARPLDLLAASEAATQTILVMDPYPHGLKEKCSVLTAAGFSVLPASDIEKTLALIGVVRPDLILMEVGSHLGTSVEILRRIKHDSRLRGVPIVMMAAIHHDERLEDLVQSLGAAAFVPCVTTPQELLSLARQYLHQNLPQK
jgi:two-component system cell cycle response regulator